MAICEDKHKVDLEKLERNIGRRDLRDYLCEIPGCNSTIIWHDKDKEEYKFSNGRTYNIGEGWGLVYSTCHHCGRKLCPHPTSKPTGGLPPPLCAPEGAGFRGTGGQLNLPRDRNGLVRFNMEDKNHRALVKSINVRRTGRQDNYDPKLGTGVRSGLPDEYKNTEHCMLECFWVDHNGNIRTLVSCRSPKCISQFEAGNTDKRKFLQLTGG